MKKTPLTGSASNWLPLRTIIVSGLCGLLLPFNAASGQAEEDEDVFELEPVTVLGSAITRFDQESGLPVSILEMNEIESDGFISPGEIFSELVFTGSPEFNETEDGPNDARGDVTSINLRGAGPGQTLVLMNGRRLAPHPLNQTVGQAPSVLVNANVMPAGLIERIDVLRDGASAIYGTDASAGVVNTVLDTNFLGNEVRLRYGQDGSGDYTEQLYTYTGGFDFNEGKTNLSLFLSYFERDPIIATDRWYARAGDKRPLVDENWRGDVSIINVSSGSVYARFETDLPGSRDELSQNGVEITDGTGEFHINAPGLPGTTAVLADGTNIDDDALPRDERYDFAPWRTLTSEVERTNFFATLHHEFSDTLKLFAEIGYYHADTWQQRAPVVIGTSDDIVIPAQNYYNPFGPVTFADGRTNPNRLSGITLQNGDPLPDEGIGIVLEGWRTEWAGPRLVDVETDSYLYTIGLKGKAYDNWYWETGIRYNLNEATDTSSNRLSKTGLSGALADDTPAALNVFSGPGANNREDFEDLIIQVSRTAETELLSYDLRANNPEVTELFGNPVGIALGIEAREETYMDDRDPRIDGTIRFDDSFQGTSDIIGVSPTEDTDSDREVIGAYAELLVPIVGEANRTPLFHRLEVQLAGRWEDYSDFGDLTKPKVGVMWYLSPDLLLRTSQAQGFTAPNLSILTKPIQRFNTGILDDYRLQWDPDNAANDGSEQLADLRGGNFGLGPEESKTKTFGIVWRVPYIEGLTLTADYWEIEITDRIGTIGTADIIDADQDILDALSANPADYSPGDVVIGDPRVERDPITQEQIDLATGLGYAPAGAISRVINPFVNEAAREISGWDFGLEYAFPETSFGRFRLTAEGSYLESFDDIEVAGDSPVSQIKDEINPRFRGKSTLSWRKDNWSASVTVNYISETVDNDVDGDDGREWVIDDYMRTSIRMGYRFNDGSLDGLAVSFGIRNLFDEDPSFNPDESFGYEPSLHSNRERYYYLDLKYSF
ncbi:TonB-dependent receptor [Puniceicoccales bacterium CK1056]|uniref:TonB-dependent receptor n=1 Tax=Oceanipulchritudo coccoides TaxID=2706888 RepID=A0A6B2LZQ5_9BACT|nr:TonB-dependent receptor [Oceanipulchritudo coccoides]NDV62201.1 TonB-dependent receptor [Oceanipulchritudo coccoides]